MRKAYLTSMILVGGISCAALAADSAPPVEFRQLFPKLLAADGQAYVVLRTQMLGLGQTIQPELRRIVESKTGSWQERALARALLARMAVDLTYPLDDLDAMLETAVLPNWALPRKPHGAENDYEPVGSPAYMGMIGWAACCFAEWEDATAELLWKGLISNPDSRRSVVARLDAENGHADHQLVVGLARSVFDRTEDLETRQLAIRAITAHLGPYRQDGRPVQDPAVVVTWLVSLAKNPQNDPNLRATIIEHVGDTGDPAATGLVLESLQQPDLRLRAAAVRGSGTILSGSGVDPQRTQLVEALAQILDSPDAPKSLVQHTIYALGSASAARNPDVAKQAAAVLEARASKTEDRLLRSAIEERLRYVRKPPTQPAARPESQPSSLTILRHHVKLQSTSQPAGSSRPAVATRRQATIAASQPATQPP